VVVLDDGVVERGKDGIAVLIAGVQAHARVLVVDTRLDGTLQGESVGRDLQVREVRRTDERTASKQKEKRKRKKDQ
jgi:hypothetical protein